MNHTGRTAILTSYLFRITADHLFSYFYYPQFHSVHIATLFPGSLSYELPRERRLRNKHLVYAKNYSKAGGITNIVI